MRWTPALLAVALVATPALAKKKAAHAHEHGKAKLSVAVDGMKIAATLEAPGDGIFGFEHPAKTTAEKASVKAAMTMLNDDGLTLFGVPASLGCKTLDVKVSAPQAEPAKINGKAPGAHADVDAAWVFECATKPDGATLKLALFEKFPRLKAVDAQIVTATGARGATLSASQSDVKL
jgi:hypothetical protein